MQCSSIAGGCRETFPVFNRNGIYLIRNRSWFEVDGKAYLFDKKIFLDIPGFYRASELDYRKINAIKSIFENKLESVEQRKLYWYIVQVENFRKYFRRGKKYKEELRVENKS